MSTRADRDRTAGDERAVDLDRVLAVKAVPRAGRGRPGTAVSPAPGARLEFCITAERVAAARDSLARVRS